MTDDTAVDLYIAVSDQDAAGRGMGPTSSNSKQDGMISLDVRVLVSQRRRRQDPSRRDTTRREHGIGHRRRRWTRRRLIFRLP